MHVLQTVALTVFLGISVVFDIRFRRIPNWLVFTGMLAGLAFSLFFDGLFGFGQHFIGLAILGGIWFVFWQSGIMGGGDQKLMMMVGAFAGSHPALPIALAVAIAGGVQALAAIVYYKHAHVSVDFDWKKVEVPYSIAIAVGTGLALLLVF